MTLITNGEYDNIYVPIVYKQDYISIFCPKTITNLKPLLEKSNSQDLYVLFHSLNKIIVIPPSESFFIQRAHLLINDDGTLVPSRTDFFPSSHIAQNYNLFVLQHYHKYDDLFDPDNYYSVYSVINTSKMRNITVQQFSSLDKQRILSGITQIFGTVYDGKGNLIPATNPDYGTSDDPYKPVDPSGPGGGGGNFDDDSDPVPLPPLPTLSGADTGFTRIYTPTLAQLQSLSRYLWTDESLIDTLWNALRKYVEDPMSVFINLSLVPVSVPVSGQEEFKVLFIPTGVTLNTMATQYVDVDCGTLELKEYYGSALDYSPNTKIACFLPYIGTVTLNTDEVMNTTIQIRYRIDVVSGACVACILVNGTTLYQYSGTCAIPIPFSSADFSSYGSALIGVGKAGAAVAAAGMGNVGLAASILGPTQKTGETTTWESSQTERNPTTGRQITTGTQQLTKTTMPTTKASFGSIAAEAGGNAVNAVIASKPIVERSGSFSGNSGYLGVRRPYLIIERPRLCMPTDFQKYNGFPSMITLKLGDCTGFTRVQQVFLQGIPATNPEEAEILDFLKAGVIL